MSVQRYFPSLGLHDEDIKSLIKLSLSSDTTRVDTHGGRIAAFECLIRLQTVGFDLSEFISADYFDKLRQRVDELKKFDPFRIEVDSTQDNTFVQYWELSSHSPKISENARTAREFIRNSRTFSLDQLKIYFNAKEIENIPDSELSWKSSKISVDSARANIIEYPIEERHNTGGIITSRGKIEQVIFNFPSEKQLIVLDFANEKIPGGRFLLGASNQEQSICKNSNVYSALLDFKYRQFDGGFLIPEFGCLYIKDAEMFNAQETTRSRYIDVIAAACYDLTGQQNLHALPVSPKWIEANTEKKFEAIIAAAQANSDTNGNRTCLIIGPIGCGEYGNDPQVIVELWAKVLSRSLNDELQTQQRHAFEQIWFLSEEEDQLIAFEKACAKYFSEDSIRRS